MALVNRTKKEINAKIVYYGPGQSGKSANLEYIYKKLKPECRGKLQSTMAKNDRMLFFDFTPAELAEPGGYSFRFHIYTLVGGVTESSTWKMLLKGVDGLVFVADSMPDKMQDNLVSFNSLVENLAVHGKALADIPCIIQCNKQDVAGALSLEEIQRQLPSGSISLVAAKAKKGEGVVNTLNRLVKMVLQRIREAEPDIGIEEKGTGKEARRGAPAKEVTPARSAGASAASAKEVAFDELASLTISQAVEAGIGGRGTVKPPASLLQAEVEEPVLELSGPVEMLADGRIRLPLAVSCGGKKKITALTVAISFEKLLDEP
jgi:signal recognition particle receptor subunit beta